MVIWAFEAETEEMCSLVLKLTFVYHDFGVCP